MVKKRGSRHHGHRLFTGIDNLGIDFIAHGQRDHAEQAIFTMEQNLTVFGQVIGQAHGLTNPQVHMRTIGDVLQNALGNLRLCSALNV